MENSSYIEFNFLNASYLELFDCLGRTHLHLLSYGVDYICDVYRFLNDASPRLTRSEAIILLRNYIDLLEKFSEEYKTVTLKPIQASRKLERRTRFINYLPSAFHDEAISKDCDILPKSISFYVNRHLVNHLLRVGYTNTAKALSQRYGLEDFVDFQIYTLVEDLHRDLDQKSILSSICWLKINKIYVKNLPNYTIVHTLLHMTIFNKILKEKSSMEALNYLRRYVSSETDVNVTHIIKNSIQMILDRRKIPTDDMVMDDDFIWNHLKALMAELVYQLYGVDKCTTLQLMIQVGLASMKTYQCVPDKMCCPCCDGDAYPIVVNVCATKYEKSIILSPNEDKIIDENSYVVLLPCGGMASLDMETCLEHPVEKSSNSKISCPLRTEFHMFSDLHRVYF